MKFNLVLAFVTGLLCMNVIAQPHLVSWNQLQTFSQTDVSGLIFTAAENGATSYKVVYNTVDVNGDPTVASGAVIIPDKPNCGYFPMVLYQHGTVVHKDNVPSRNYSYNAQGLGFAAFGFVSVMPDYLGLGDNPPVHPYHHSETEATAALDLIRAARELLVDTMRLHLNDELFITGYSQGGHAAMAALKYIEDNSLTTEFNVLAAAPLSGAYNLSGVQSAEMEDSIYSSPGYLPYIIESYQLAYGNIFSSYSDIYDSPYDVNIPGYFDGNTSLSTLNGALPNNIYDFMVDSFLDDFIADTMPYTHPLRLALQDNDNHDWAPTTHVRMCYCGQDEQVSFQNSIIAEDSMNAKGAFDVEAVNISPIFNHSTCFLPAMTYAKDWFVTMATQCVTVTSIDELEQEPRINIASDGRALRLNFEGIKADHQLTVHDITGRKMMQQKLSGQSQTINLSNLPPGMYVANLNGSDTKKVHKFQVY